MLNPQLEKDATMPHFALPEQQQQAVAATAAASSTATPAPQQPLLPADVWRLIIARLDPWTRRQLQLACSRLRLLTPLPASTVPLCSLNKQRAAAGYLVVGPPRRTITLGCLDAGRRCEQRLCVGCDNLAPTSLDISAALPRREMSLAAVGSLVDSLPGLTHVALPPCPAAPRVVLRLLAALPLQTCDLDCRLFTTTTGSALQDWQELRGMRQLRALQLQHVHPLSLPSVLAALSCTPTLACLSLRGLPAMADLTHLSSLSSLTRLELRVTTTGHGRDHHQPGQGRGASTLLSKAAGARAAAPWSSLPQLRELVLLDVCLDSQLLEATAACSQLTRLAVAGVQLAQQPQQQHHGCPRLAGLQHLTATQSFDLGGALARDVLPALLVLSISVAATSAQQHVPLTALQRHPTLATLSVEVAVGVLQELQLAHLVRCPALRALRLAVAPAAGHQAPAACLPVVLPSQVTSLALRGAANDHALARLAASSPHLQRLTLDHCGCVSDGGLQKLAVAPALRLLVLRCCHHVSPWGLEHVLQRGGLAAVAVLDCAGIPERACHSIRRACRASKTRLLWYGCAPSPAPTSPPAARASFLTRCWRQQQQRPPTEPSHLSETDALVAAATAVAWS